MISLTHAQALVNMMVKNIVVYGIVLDLLTIMLTLRLGGCMSAGIGSPP